MRTRLRWLLFADTPGTVVLAVLGVSIGLMLITLFPYYVFESRTPPGFRFMGTFDGLADQNCYFAWMRQAALGRAVWREHMTSEPHAPVFFNSLWYALGRASAILGMSLERTYQAARFVFGLVFYLVLYRFLCLFVRDLRQRWYAFLLAATGAGFGGILAPLVGELRPDLSVDLLIPEAFSFYAVLAYPHFALSLTFMLAALALHARGVETGRVRSSVGAGLVTLLLATFHPYVLATIGAVATVHIALRARVGQARPRDVIHLVALLGPSLPQVAYLVWATSTSPVMASWSRGVADTCRSYAPLGYLMGYGLAGFLAVSGLRRVFAWESQEPQQLFVSAWLLAGVPLLYSFPLLTFERRLSEGLQVPIVLVAVSQLFGPVSEALAGTPSGRRWGVERVRRWLPPLVVLLSLPTTVWLVARPLVITASADRLDDKYYLHQDELLALACLAQTAGENDVVLSSVGIGNYIPRCTDARVFCGHYGETIHYAQRQADVARFFQARSTDAFRKRLLADRGITYVWWGLEEKETATLDPHSMDALIPVVAAERVALFRVDRGRLPVPSREGSAGSGSPGLLTGSTRVR